METLPFHKISYTRKSGENSVFYAVQEKNWTVKESYKKT